MQDSQDGLRQAAQAGLATISVLVAAALAATTGFAQSAAPDKSSYTLFNPTPTELLRSFNTDRPTKSNVPFTVDAGHFQYELDVANFFHQQTGVATLNSITAVNTWLKFGINNSIDLEINLPAPQAIETRIRATGSKTTASGFNDTFVRAKFNLWGNDGGPSAFTIEPTLKVPTAARGLGNGAVEGGVLSLLSFSLPGNTTLLFNNEVDHLKDLAGNGYHTNVAGLVNLSRPIFKDVTLYGELWTAQNYDPTRTIRQFSLDTGLAWTIRPNTQVDIGANFGLNSNTPAVQAYVGLAQRF